ncbi:aldo/keto reductase [Microbacterium sp. YY-01]|uniref:aldo/keto reductase n=1 Tax=Microbacterium sp. YY-01 TaxID=3421634 RepID=UPI003D180925
MRSSGVGTVEGPAQTPTRAQKGPTPASEITQNRDADSVWQHPSAPIPVQGPGIGSRLRVSLGQSAHRIFPLILGGAEFGWNTDTAMSHRILDRYAEFGGNMVHTSDGFSGGRSEYIIGEWLAQRRLRDDIVVAARVGTHPDNPGLGPVNLVRAVEATLTRMNIDTIDVLYLHAKDDATALDDTLATAEWLVEAGKVRTIGVRGFDAVRLVEARILASAGYPLIEVLDAPYNLLRRAAFDGDLRLVAAAQSLAVTPSHALEHGFLAGHHRTRADTRQGARGLQLREHVNRRGLKTLKALDAIAHDVQATPAAVAVAWLLHQRTITAPIVNARSVEHVDELMKGVGIDLTRAHMSDLQRASA